MNPAPDRSKSPSSNPNQWRGADIAWDNVPDDDEILELEPIDPGATAARAQFHTSDEVEQAARILEQEKAEIVKQNEQPLINLQFSLSRLLMGTTLVGVVLGITQWMAPNVFAGILGTVVLATIAIAAFVEIDDPKIKTGWWCLVGVYLIATLIAFVRG